MSSMVFAQSVLETQRAMPFVVACCAGLFIQNNLPDSNIQYILYFGAVTLGHFFTVLYVNYRHDTKKS